MGNTSSVSDKRFMRIALALAKRGLKTAAPNPAVGCIIVKNGRVIANGFHKSFGGPHAEAKALKKAGTSAAGATLYVNLEPCCHLGKTPPCAEAIVDSGIKRVVAAMADPNPINKNKGFAYLRGKGIDVTAGVLRKDAEALNKQFAKQIRRERPFITVKVAQSIDGKIATWTGDSKWISSQASRRVAHMLRRRHDAIMIGVNTAINDDPLLTNRLKSKSAHLLNWQPKKIVVDSTLKTPASSKFLNRRLSPADTIIAATRKAPKAKEKIYADKGAEVLRVRAHGGRVDLKDLMKKLWQKGIRSILAEGGGELTASLLENNLADKAVFFIAPKVIGGKNAITSVEGRGAREVRSALRLYNLKIKRIKEDFIIEGDVYRDN